MAVAHRVYAQALLEAARGEGALARVREELDDVAAAVAETPELARFLANPQIDPGTKRAVLEDLFEGSSETFLNFVRLLVEKNRIDQVPEIHREWQRLIAAEERVLELELVTAVELSEEAAAAIVGQIEEASGRRVEAVRSVDPALIGGVVVQAGSLRVDASVRGRLNQLRQELLTRR